MPAYLALEDGTVYAGEPFGGRGTSVGEIVFNTNMTGYQEIITDPSYSGQIVVMTYPEIGNYGISSFDNESNKPSIRGFIVKKLSKVTSSWRAEGSLEDFLKASNVIGLQGIDTRAVTRKIRYLGALRAVISTEISDPDQLVTIAKSSPLIGEEKELVIQATTQSEYVMLPEGKSKGKIAILDFGLKSNIARIVVKFGFTAVVYPALTDPDVLLLNQGYNGIILSNGPGDPNVLIKLLENVKKLLGSGIPVFGICLGHQLIGLALGCSVSKLKFGHRGGNHPVKHLATGKVEITSQNHSFAIDPDSIGSDIEITYINLNDGTIEGIKHKYKPIFAVQYHPEAAPGPKDTNYLLKEFLNYVLTPTDSLVGPLSM